MIAFLLPVWIALRAAWAVTQADVDAISACLAAQDVACAQQVVARTGLDRSDDPTLLAIAAEVAFHASDYPAAHDLMARAVSLGFRDDQDRLGLYERTMFATAGWVEVAQGRFRVRYRPGVDAVLVEDAIAALEGTDRHVTPLLGPVPPGTTVVEFYPDGRSFVAASSLTRDDVEATGVVAISKWTRLLVSSPRALGRGYDWASTLSHEYIHLVVAAATRDRAPVWLQEAIAKYLDGRWAHGRAEFRLDLHVQGLLADALANDGLVPFDEMHPSLAKIKVLREDGSIDRAASAERAALAYGQLASLMDFCFREAGEQVLLRTLPAIRDGADPREALATAAGRSSFESLVADWEAWIRRQGLVDRDLQAMPTVLDGGTDAELDPVLSKRRDLANFVRLGDLLVQRGHARAALIEYEKARDEEDPSSPLLANRVAKALLALGEIDRARERLQEAARDYPTYPLTWRTLGEIAEKRGARAEAIDFFEKATSFAPFDLDVQRRLLALYREAGDERAAERRARIVRILERGGEDVERPPIHERSGTYELPRDPELASRRESAPAGVALTGRKAPDFAATALDGTRIRVSELRGKVVLVDFWATWCGPCKMVMPELSRMATELGPQGLVVLGVSDEPEATVKRWVAQEEARGRAYAQRLAVEDGSGRRAYGVRSIPTLVIIDRNGTVRGVHVGAADLGGIRAIVTDLLGGDASEPATP